MTISAATASKGWCFHCHQDLTTTIKKIELIVLHFVATMTEGISPVSFLTVTVCVKPSSDSTQLVSCLVSL